MSQPQFDIQIGKDGKVVVKVSGVSGKECTALSDMLKEIVGREESRETTAEYYGAPGNVRIETRAEVRDRRPT
ncbi:MAG: DUF2997 domain-containing protein [Phycisphaerales bacterium]